MNTEAQELKDLVPTKAPKRNNQAVRFQAAAAEEDSDEEPRQRAHPEPNKNGLGRPAERPRLSPERIKALKKEICQPFLYSGKCKHGDNCYRSQWHVSYEEVAGKVTGRTDSRRPKRKPRESEPSDGQVPKCQLFKEGSCTYGDKCKFRHVKMVRIGHNSSPGNALPSPTIIK